MKDIFVDHCFEQTCTCITVIHGIRVVSPVGRFAGSFRPESFRPGFIGGLFRPY